MFGVKKAVVCGLLGLLFGTSTGHVQSAEKRVDLYHLPANRWVQLADGPCNAFAQPVYDPVGKRLVALLAAGNGTAHLDFKRGTWEMDLAPTDVPRGGDQPLMKVYRLQAGRPNYANMPLFHMTAYDTRRKRILAGATQFFAAYDPASKMWTDLEAEVELFGKTYSGVPLAAWGAMCYDPVNDELVMFPGGAVFNFDHWEKDKEVTGHLGTCIYSPKTNRWTRPDMTPPEYARADEVLRALRIELQESMSAMGEAIILKRNGQPDKAERTVAGEMKRLGQLAQEYDTKASRVPKKEKQLKELWQVCSGLLESIRLSVGEGRIEPDDLYRHLFRSTRWLEEDLGALVHTQPHPRMLSPMVYLPDHKSILMFGGTDGYQHLNDTWLYDCTKRKWIQKETYRRPEPRAGHVLVYHPGLGKAVMLGGFKERWADAKDQLREVWIYDAEADDWNLVLDDFPIKRGCGSYYGAYCPQIDAIVVLRDGKETFALRLDPQVSVPKWLSAPPSPNPEDPEPFLPPEDDPEVLARWDALPANTWVAADTPWEPGEHGWGMMGYNGQLHAAMMWGGGHSSHQANEITLYFPGANRWVLAYPPHRIDIPPWNKACGNPGGVDVRGGVLNLHARNGLAGNGTKALIGIQCFSPYWYGPEAMLDQPLRWGRTTLFEFDFFSRRWRMPLPATPATGMCYPYNAKNTVMAVDHTGARYFDRDTDDWKIVVQRDGPEHVTGGEGTGPGYLFIEKKNLAMAVGPPSGNRDGPIETWVMDLGDGRWRQLEPRGKPPGRPTALAYCEADDCVYAACFTGWDAKTLDGGEGVYSFKHNAWMTLPTKVRPRDDENSSRRRTMRPYHGAWAKVVFSPRYNLLLNFQEDGGMWVMRPGFAELDWGR